MGKRHHGMGTVTEYRPGRWQIKYTTKDGERRTKAGFRSEPDAQSALAAAITDVARSDYFDERKGKIPFGVVAREHLEQAELAPRTKKNYETLLRTALASFDTLPIGEITIRKVDLWWSRQAAHPVNRRNAYFFMRAIMKRAVRWGYIRTSPCTIEGAGKDVAKPRPTWTVKNYLDVLEHLDPYFVPMLEVIFAGHLRLNEARGLNAADYDRTTGRITVVKQGSGENTKRGQHKTIKLLEPGIEAMTAYLTEHPRIGAVPLFVGPRGARMPAQTLRAAWDAACRAAGYENFHIHDVRHVGLTEIARASRNPKDIMARAGHASPSSTMRYIHTDDERDAEIASLASARLRRRA